MLLQAATFDGVGDDGKLRNRAAPAIDMAHLLNRVLANMLMGDVAG
jgi:hypothetical protein